MASQLPTREEFLANGITENVKCRICFTYLNGVQKLARIATAGHDCGIAFCADYLHNYFATKTNNCCPECNTPLFKLPSSVFLPGRRLGATWPILEAPCTVDRFDLSDAQEFVKQVWQNVYQFVNNNDIYDSDIDGKIALTLEKVHALNRDMSMAPTISFRHQDLVRKVVKEMIEEQRDNPYRGRLSDDEVLTMWMERMGEALGWSFGE